MISPLIERGKTFADARAFLKKAKRVFVAVPHNGPDSRSDYAQLSRKSARDFLAVHEPDAPLYCSFHHNNDVSHGATLFIGSPDLTTEGAS